MIGMRFLSLVLLLAAPAFAAEKVFDPPKDGPDAEESGIPALDRSAESAILNSQPFPPLPAQWTDPDLAFRLTFQYTQ